MIVTCPNCTKRYMLDNALLPKEGRQVRCITCLYVWRQNPETSSSVPHSPVGGIPDIAIEARPPHEKQSSWLGWLIFNALVLCLIVFLSFGRNYIVKICPEMQQIYEWIGLNTELLGAGLSITNAAFHIQQDGSIEMIQLTGDIMNISDRTRDIPSLKITSMGEASSQQCLKNQQTKACVLDYWEHRLSKNSLQPGEHTHFETAPRPKVEGTQQISVEF